MFVSSLKKENREFISQLLKKIGLLHLKMSIGRLIHFFGLGLHQSDWSNSIIGIVFVKTSKHKKEHFQGMFWEHRTKAFFAVSCLTFSRINIIIIVGGEVKKKQFFSSVFVLFMII